MYAREIQGKEFTFDFAEGLLKDNLLFVDRETSSVWSQLDGGAVSGPMEGTPLRSVPSIQTTWKFWRERHPDTRVMVVPEKPGRRYLYRNRKPGTRPAGPRPTTHDTSALGLGLFVGAQPMFFPLRELERGSTPLKLTVEGQPLTIHYRKAALTAWGEDARGNLLSGVLAYEDGWLAFNPKSKVYRAPRP